MPPEPEEAIFASTTTWSLSILTSFCLKSGASARIEVIAMHPGEAARLAPLDLVLVQLGDGVDELLEHLRRGVLEAVPGLVVGRVLQPEVGAQVDHLHPGLDELWQELHRLPVRERGEDRGRPLPRPSRGRCPTNCMSVTPLRLGCTRKRYSPAYLLELAKARSTLPCPRRSRGALRLRILTRPARRRGPSISSPPVSRSRLSSWRSCALWTPARP